MGNAAENLAAALNAIVGDVEDSDSDSSWETLSNEEHTEETSDNFTVNDTESINHVSDNIVEIGDRQGNINDIEDNSHSTNQTTTGTEDSNQVSDTGNETSINLGNRTVSGNADDFRDISTSVIQIDGYTDSRYQVGEHEESRNLVTNNVLNENVNLSEQSYNLEPNAEEETHCTSEVINS